MEAWIHELTSTAPGWGLGLTMVIALVALAKGADLLVDEAVALSVKWHIPKAVIGATIVSLGTTLPEAAVSVFAAVKGSPGLALGNAVGSIICDTGLILGLAIIINPMRIDPVTANRQGWLQFGCGILLVVASWSWVKPLQVWETGGILSQQAGFFFLVLLVLYLGWSIQSSRKQNISQEEVFDEDVGKKTSLLILKLLGGILLVILSSQVLIPAARESALRLHVPEGIIAATLVAFGTSLPELVTVITAALKGHGELGLGNVIGADILNVLFVAGASAAVTPGGLVAGPSFFTLLFPAMLMVLVTFRIGIWLSGDRMKRGFGFILLAAYLAATFLSYWI